ncbi:hypothetical protein V0R50_31050 [Pseudomonas sp. 148P]|uniref:Integron gene cassette protein n=1 Tax=Pseudomonas ulcerans TaxID=3115852 RepID=A0ABU7I1H9_9PSED|nr:MULTISPECIES: hypothetical protein [unclassified Pseudomonas]MEE1926458.1 hypothetical protein [Pseudomonas sp. 147P]MEE1937682.1 hypothetical protein [Pseudomonas sp. 148P]
MSVEISESESCLELCTQSGLSKPPAEITRDPVWERVQDALIEVFACGGFVELRVISPRNGFVSELCMKSKKGEYRLIVLTRSADPKSRLFEWWERGDDGYRGMVRFGDDDWDARTVCDDISVACLIFKELFESGDLVSGLSQMRSEWDPKE